MTKNRQKYVTKLKIVAAILKAELLSSLAHILMLLHTKHQTHIISLVYLHLSDTS